MCGLDDGRSGHEGRFLMSSKKELGFFIRVCKHSILIPLLSMFCTPCTNFYSDYCHLLEAVWLRRNVLEHIPTEFGSIQKVSHEYLYCKYFISGL